MTNQIEPYTEWWSDQNQRAVDDQGPLLVSIGDSTAIGIGASHPERSYVGRLRNRLSEHRDESWRVLNLARSGARLNDGIDRQLPILDRLRAEGLEPSLVVACIGTNDLVWGRETAALRAGLRTLVHALPEEAVVATLAGGSARAQLANRTLRTAADERGVPIVVPWGEPGPSGRDRLASDRFHPNDIGYELMSRPFARHLGLPADEATAIPDGPGDDG